jgi:hypothetical protein
MIMTTTTVDRRAPASAPSGALLRWAPLTGILAIICFVVGVVASSPPGTSDSNAKWTAAYSGSHDTGHILTGVALVISGLAFLAFSVGLWQRITEHAATGRFSALPIAASAVTAACMSVGGVLMAAPSTVVGGGGPVPGPDVLRLCNNTGFAMVAVPGMLAAALAVAVFSVQGRGAGYFGRKLLILGLVVAVVLLASLQFLPILAWLIWMAILAVYQLRQNADAPAPR